MLACCRTALGISLLVASSTRSSATAVTADSDAWLFDSVAVERSFDAAPAVDLANDVDLVRYSIERANVESEALDPERDNPQRRGVEFAEAIRLLLIGGGLAGFRFGGRFLRKRLGSGWTGSHSRS